MARKTKQTRDHDTQIDRFRAWARHHEEMAQEAENDDDLEGTERDLYASEQRVLAASANWAACKLARVKGKIERTRKMLRRVPRT